MKTKWLLLVVFSMFTSLCMAQTTRRTASTQRKAATTQKKSSTPQKKRSGIAVDLGLPSGTFWANMNVGASKPEDFGNYFAWGETKPQREGQYNWKSYKWCNGEKNTLTKYCSNPNCGYNKFTDDKTTLEPEDDAATVNWGATWCTPTKEQWTELLNNTTIEDTRLNRILCYKFTSKINGNSIILPAAGWYNDGSHLNVNMSIGFAYWASTISNYQSGIADNILGTSTSGSMRYHGYPVRPVRKN